MSEQGWRNQEEKQACLRFYSTSCFIVSALLSAAVNCAPSTLEAANPVLCRSEMSEMSSLTLKSYKHPALALLIPLSHTNTNCSLLKSVSDSSYPVWFSLCLSRNFYSLNAGLNNLTCVTWCSCFNSPNRWWLIEVVLTVLYSFNQLVCTCGLIGTCTLNFCTYLLKFCKFCFMLTS